VRQALLAAEGLTRRYGDRVVVDGLSFSVAAGEVFGFLGPNGAGKTTTFEMLSGLRAPDSGTFLWKGAKVAPTSPILRERLGVIFQKPALDDKLTARENLFLGGSLYGVPRAELRARIEVALKDAELTDRAAEPIARYSGGMRRRLELQRVLLHDPELLVLDEPTQGLDPGFRRAYWKRLRQLVDERRLAVLLTTHDPEEAEQCDRLVVIDAGKIVAEGTPDELRARVGGDVVTVEADDPEALAQEIGERLGIAATCVDHRVVLPPRPAGHELIPRLVEAFPKGRLRSVSSRAPSLADVFVKLTGRQLA
jgi:ABC-2 type transport system ATP-binding protein